MLEFLGYHDHCYKQFWGDGEDTGPLHARAERKAKRVSGALTLCRPRASDRQHCCFWAPAGTRDSSCVAPQCYISTHIDRLMECAIINLELALNKDAREINDKRQLCVCVRARARVMGGGGSGTVIPVARRVRKDWEVEDHMAYVGRAYPKQTVNKLINRETQLTLESKPQVLLEVIFRLGQTGRIKV